MFDKEEMDKIVIELFDCLEDYFRERNLLTTYLTDGFINMSKARYSMGPGSVTSLQYDLKELRASQKVINKKNDFQLIDEKIENDLDSMNINEERLELKQRKKKENDHKTKINKFNQVTDARDPLNWFGILVPQALKDSQKMFQHSLPLICSLVTTQEKIRFLIDKYKQLNCKS